MGRCQGTFGFGTQYEAVHLPSCTFLALPQLISAINMMYMYEVDCVCS